MDKLIQSLRNKKLQAAAAGLCAVFGVYLAFCLSTIAISHGRAVYMLLHLFVLGMAGAAYLLFCRLSADWESVRKQAAVINGVLLVCAVLFFAANLLIGGTDSRTGMDAVGNAAGFDGRNTDAAVGVFGVYERLSQILCVVITSVAELLLLGKKNRKAAWENTGSRGVENGGRAEEPCASGRVAAAGSRRGGFGGFIVSHMPLFLLCLITMILVYDPGMRQFKWDGGLYYLACRSASVYSVSSMALYGHISQTVGASVCFLTALMGNDLAAGMVLGNALMLLISICAFYGTMKVILPKRRESVYVTAAAVYAWSPFALGMVNYYSLDFYCMCLFAVVLYYTVRRQWLLQAVTGLFFCFTKEPAIVVYGMLCIGIVAADLWRDGRGKISDKLKRLFCTPQYYAMASAAVLWGATIMMLGAWSGGNGGFSVDHNYIFEKCKVLYVLNFNWLCTAFVLAGGMILILSKKITSAGVRMLLPLVSAQAGFTLFSCLFRTVNHARYADISPVCLYLLCCLVLAQLAELFLVRRGQMRGCEAGKPVETETRPVQAPTAKGTEENRKVAIRSGRILSAVYTALALILLISCYRTIDPVSLAVFRVVDIGGDTMITTGTPAPGDAMIYNKQALWFERALSKAVSDIDLEEDVILFPAVGGSAYHFEGFAEAQSLDAGEYRIFEEYWNQAYQIREPAPVNDSIPFQAAVVTDMEAVRRLMREHPARRYVYIYAETAGADMAGEIGRACRVTEAEEYVSGGWQVYRMTFEAWE